MSIDECYKVDAEVLGVSRALIANKDISSLTVSHISGVQLHY